jgi:hypothetical protein
LTPGAMLSLGQTLILGATLSPRGEVVPQGWILFPGGDFLCSPLYSSKQ